MIEIQIRLMVYGTGDVPELSEKDALTIKRWYCSMMDHLPGVEEFMIEHICGDKYKLSYSCPSNSVDANAVCNPDVYGGFPVVIDGNRYIVEGLLISPVDGFEQTWCGF